jgi:hypothetical protein
MANLKSVRDELAGVRKLICFHDRPAPQENISPFDESLNKTELQGSVRRPERFQAKWTPVRAKKTRQNKKIEPRF